MPTSQREEFGRPSDPQPWEHPKKHETTHSDLSKNLLRGGFPELVANPDRDISLWHSSYVQTYLVRDIRSLRQMGDLLSFQSFLRALAARTGQLPNLTDIARDLGIAVNTAKAWLSVLEATFQVIVLRPYHANVGKRLVKTPKAQLFPIGHRCLGGSKGCPANHSVSMGRKVRGSEDSASDTEISAAYHLLARMSHPDKVAGLAPEYQEIADKKTKEINAAYEILKHKC